MLERICGRLKPWISRWMNSGLKTPFHNTCFWVPNPNMMRSGVVRSPVLPDAIRNLWSLLFAPTCLPWKIDVQPLSRCYSMPCWRLSFSKFSWRSARSSFDLAIFSGWWYKTSTTSQLRMLFGKRFIGRIVKKKNQQTARLTYEITVLKVEPVQFVARLFRIHNVLVNDECGPFGITGDSLSYLTSLYPC